MNHASFATPRAASLVAPQVQETVTAWAMDELAHWRLHPLNAQSVRDKLHAIHSISRSIFLYKFEGSSVFLLEKPAGVDVEPSGQRRALAYLGFFSSICRFLPAGYRSLVAVEVGDKLTEKVDVPVFCFQKRRGAAPVLLPDIDFLDFDFYESDIFVDRIPYADKVEKAIFVGGTTGGRITPEIARSCSLPRLRAARFFQSRPRVEFLLPQIVQTSNEAARAVLEQMPFCAPGRLTWPHQLTRRFLISMDGNGATCSRVAIALGSNSILLKYQSDEMLYYFRQLQPWQHYVPVVQDSDLEAIIDLEEQIPEVFAAIAENGQRFATDYLSRRAVQAYMLALLVRYAECFTALSGSTESVPQGAWVESSEAPASEGTVFVAHVENLGDVGPGADGWVGQRGGDKSIEGFTFSLARSHRNCHFTYCALRADGMAEPPTQAGVLCGTRGQARPIHGFTIDLTTDASDPLSIVYEGVFRDGFASGELTPGLPCRSPTGAPLVAMRIAIS